MEDQIIGLSISSDLLVEAQAIAASREISLSEFIAVAIEAELIEAYQGGK